MFVARATLLDALAGRSRDVRVDDVGLRSETEGRGEGEAASDIARTISSPIASIFDSLVSFIVAS